MSSKKKFKILLEEKNTTPDKMSHQIQNFPIFANFLNCGINEPSAIYGD